MTTLQITIPEDAIHKAVVDAMTRVGTTAIRVSTPPLQRAIEQHMQSLDGHIADSVKLACQEVLSDLDFKAEMKKSIKNAMIAEAIKIGQRAARKAAMGAE